MPYMIDGTQGAQFIGTGLVVQCDKDEKTNKAKSKSKGLVVVDRNTVPASLGDVFLSVGSSLEVRRACACLFSN
jgi:hypothetical protein